MISDRWTLNYHVISQPLVVSLTQALLIELPRLTVALLFNEGLPFYDFAMGTCSSSKWKSRDEITYNYGIKI